MNGRGIMKSISSNRILPGFIPLSVSRLKISRQGNVRQRNDKKDFSEKYSSAVHSPAFIPLTNIPLSTSHA
jgi:hypothetical protein